MPANFTREYVSPSGKIEGPVMDVREALESLKLKFTSGNDITVERTTITAEEFEPICRHLEATMAEVEAFELPEPGC